MSTFTTVIWLFISMWQTTRLDWNLSACKWACLIIYIFDFSGLLLLFPHQRCCCPPCRVLLGLFSWMQNVGTVHANILVRKKLVQKNVNSSLSREVSSLFTFFLPYGGHSTWDSSVHGIEAMAVMNKSIWGIEGFENLWCDGSSSCDYWALKWTHESTLSLAYLVFEVLSIYFIISSFKFLTFSYRDDGWETMTVAVIGHWATCFVDVSV